MRHETPESELQDFITYQEKSPEDAVDAFISQDPLQ